MYCTTGFSTMLTRCEIPVFPSLLPPSVSPIRQSRADLRPACTRPRLPSLLICRCSGKSNAINEEYGRPARDPSKDTRIHWGSSDEGWVGTTDFPDAEADVSPNEEVLSTNRNGQNGPLMGLLVHAADSHYRYLELTPDAETEDIKAAYRRLSKTYHPDTTSLPLEQAAEKFVRLKEAYSVLSSEEDRRFYDWQLAQKISKQQGGRFIWPSEAGKRMADDGSPLSTEVGDAEKDIVMDPVDRLGGQNMDLSGQALTAILFDAFAVIVSILCIAYVLFFKQV